MEAGKIVEQKKYKKYIRHFKYDVYIFYAGLLI